LKRDGQLEAAIYLFLFILLCGFFKLQVLEGNYYRRISENNRIRTIPIISARGRIYDRFGNPLAENKPILNLSIIPDDFDMNYVAKIAEIIEEDPDWLKDRIENAKTSRERSHPLLIKKDVKITAIYRLEEISTLMGGVIIDKASLRYYPEEDIVAHVVGYIGKINRKEYLDNKHRGWLFNDYIGRAGIEKTFNDPIMGTPGGRQVEVDAKGRQLRILSKKDPIIGEDIHLTLDVRLQERLVNLLDGDQNIALVVLDVNNGDILSMISMPSYDPNIFMDATRSSLRLEVLKDERRPIVNRAVSFAYSPGSVFKVLIGTAALQEGVITPSTTFICEGEYRINQRSRAFKCWKEEGHGEVNIMKAVEQSCNIFFYRTGLRLGSDKIAK